MPGLLTTVILIMMPERWLKTLAFKTKLEMNKNLHTETLELEKKSIAVENKVLTKHQA